MLVRKKPVVVEAHQWFKNGDHPADKIGQWVHTSSNWHDGYTRKEGVVVQPFRSNEPGYVEHQKHVLCGNTWGAHGWVTDGNGGHIVCPGDWILTNIQNEYYPCKPNIFNETYEEVSHD